jgi:DNA-binding MarR family transcriptional regulator
MSPRRLRHRAELDVDDAVRALLLVMPRLVGRAKRLGVPEALRSLSLAPRHLSLLSFLLLDGPMTVNELAQRLEVAPTTVSLMVSDLSRAGVLERREDDTDRRRRIVGIAKPMRAAVEAWLAPGAAAWRAALTPLTAAERAAVVRALQSYEEAGGRRRGYDPLLHVPHQGGAPW